MIPNSYDIKAFFKKINGMQQMDAIQMAHREATMVERRMLSQKVGANKKMRSIPPNCAEYSQILKEFITFVRYSARPKIADQAKYQLFQTYLESLGTQKKLQRV